jgi:hypothetical protein
MKDKNYEDYFTLDVIVFQSKKNPEMCILSDYTTEDVLCWKPLKYINTIGMNLKQPYKVRVARYTNARGYTEFDLIKVYSYQPLESGKSAPVKKKSPQATTSSKTSANKPAWLK